MTSPSGILILAHRIEIREQIEAALALAGVAYGVIAPGRPETDDQVQIASIATLAQPKRLERWRDKFDFIVIDEAHHAVAGSWARVVASQPRAHLLGVTATPERLDGRGLSEIFDALVIGPSTAELTPTWLSLAVVFEPAQAPDLSDAKIRAGDFAVEDMRDAMGGVVIGAAVAEYQRICPGVPTVVFCVDVQHSQEVAERFRQAGVRAEHVDGETPASDRRRAIAGLSDGSVQVLCNCGLISEGVDVPSIGAAILLRPTASLALYLQQVGRALRPAPGKDKALILDFSGNVARFGLPDAPRAWSLESKPTRQRAKADGPPLRKCPSCTALDRPAAHQCANCGADLRTPKERREIEMRLAETQRREMEDAVFLMPRHERVAWAGDDLDRLRLVARLSGFKPGWAHFQRQRVLEGSAS